LSSLLLFIIKYYESAYLSVHHILTHVKKSVLYLNKATLTISYDLMLGKILKLLVLTTCVGSDSSKIVSSGTVNDLHAIVLDFLKSYRNQIVILILFIF